MTHKLIKTDNYLLVVDDSEIQVGDDCLCDISSNYFGVVAYNGAFAEHYYKKIIAHLPLNGSPVLEGVPLLPPIDDDVLKMAKDYLLEQGYSGFAEHGLVKNWMAEFYNKAKEKFLLELDKQILDFTHDLKKTSSQHQRFEGALFGLNRLKYYLSQYPTEFECELENYCGSPFTTERCPKCIDICDRAYQRPKTITTSQGIQWVGKYI
jgi:hypothetical protein